MFRWKVPYLQMIYATRRLSWLIWNYLVFCIFPLNGTRRSQTEMEKNCDYGIPELCFRKLSLYFGIRSTLRKNFDKVVPSLLWKHSGCFSNFGNERQPDRYIKKRRGNLDQNRRKEPPWRRMRRYSAQNARGFIPCILSGTLKFWWLFFPGDKYFYFCSAL